MIELTKTKHLANFAFKAQEDARYALKTIVITPTHFQVTDGHIVLVQPHYQEDEFRALCGDDVENFVLPAVALRQALRECKRYRQVFLGQVFLGHDAQGWYLVVVDGPDIALRVPLQDGCCGQDAPQIDRIIKETNTNLSQGETVTVSLGSQVLEKLAKAAKDSKSIGVRFEFTVKEGAATMDPVAVRFITSPDLPIEVSGGVMPLLSS